GPDNPSADAAQFVSLVNSARAKHGAPPLSVDGELASLARAWAQQMADGVCGTKADGSPAHICHANNLSAGVSADWEKIGENVGYGPDVGSVMDAFMASSKH